MKKQTLRVISAAAVLSMLLGCGTYMQPAYAEESTIPNADLAPAADVIGTNGGIKVSVKEEGELSSNSINPTFTITNTSDKEMNLEDLKLKYYYTADGEQDQTFNCYYAGTVDGNYQALTSYVQGTIVKMDKTAENADSYMELTFNGGILEAGQSAMIQTSINKSDWSNYDRSNDYSYDNADKIAGYINDKIVCGEELEGEEKLPEIFSNNAVFDKNNPDDIVFNVTPDTSTLLAIQGLKFGEDYTVSDNKIIIKNSYLSKLEAGDYTLEFVFCSGEVKKQINVVKSGPVRYLEVRSDSKQVKQGEEISIPVNISGVYSGNSLDGAYFELKYDTNVLENVSVEAGDICINPERSFCSKVNSDTGSIKVLYNDTTAEGLEDIIKDGEFFTIKARVKDDAVDNGKVLSVSNPGAFYSYGDTEFYSGFRIGDINIIKADPVKAPEVNPQDGTFDKYRPEDINFTMNLNGNDFEGITGLNKDVDYKVSDNVVTLTKSYLNSLPVGNYELNFEFSSGEIIKVPLNILDVNDIPVDNKIKLTSDEIQCTAGEDVDIPVKLSGLSKEKDLCGCVFKLQYDADLLEDVTVTAGPICVKKYFSKKIDKTTGVISIFFADDSDEGLSGITEDGVLLNIHAGVKWNAAGGSHKALKVYDKGSFSDKDYNDYLPEFNLGSIYVKYLYL